MKKIKKLLPVLLMSIMSVSAFAEDAVIDGIKYSLNDETSEAEVRSNYYNKYSGDITIPESVDYNDKTYSVTSIGGFAFYECSGLTSITIPNSVTSIGKWAFSYCSGLTSVTIGNSVTNIGDYAFSYCSGLKSVTIPNSVTSIGNRAFSYCSGLTSVTIPNSVTSIGENAFLACSVLESIIVEEGNTIYDSRENCNAIIETATNTLIAGFKNTVIPNSVTSIGTSAFNYCTGLTSITIPNSVTSIGTGAFYECTGLTSIIIPNSVTTIGYYAFGGCESLTSVTIPNSVTIIGRGAFSSCLGLESIIVENGNTIYDSRDNCNAIIETETNTLIAGCKNTVIPNSVTSIGEAAFYECSGLTSVTIPNSVTSIGSGAFYGCSGLTSVTIGNSVTSIGKDAFGYCPGLTSITIPNSVTNIGDLAFHGCPGLTSVISLIEKPFEINENTFYNWVEDHDEFTTATLYVPAGTKEKYESTPAWNKFANIVEGIENAVKSVETDAQAEETVRYNVGGQRISSPQKGLNIVKMSDGTTRKIMCK